MQQPEEEDEGDFWRDWAMDFRLLYARTKRWHYWLLAALIIAVLVALIGPSFGLPIVIAILLGTAAPIVFFVLLASLV